MHINKLLFSCLCLCFCTFKTFAQNQKPSAKQDTLSIEVLKKRYLAASDFIDAAIGSISSLNSLIKKENYRNKISSFNNPTSSDLGFNLEGQIQAALKPLLSKSKNTNQAKFSQVVSSLIQSPGKTGALGLTPTTSIFNSLVGMVGSLTTQEKRITKEDLDSFMYVAGKYFQQFEKLNFANRSFDQKIDKLDLRLLELQIDLKEYMIDLIVVLNPSQQRSSLKTKNLEELLLKHLDRNYLENYINSFQGKNVNGTLYFPSDGIKAAKEISSTIQKIFMEYQKIYTDNYSEIKTILLESKSLGKDINIKQVDASVKELETLYNESKSADVFNLRINTLNERLKTLVTSEALKN